MNTGLARIIGHFREHIDATSEEIIIATGLNAHTASARLADLRGLGLIVATDRQRRNRTGRSVTVYEIAPRGLLMGQQIAAALDAEEARALTDRIKVAVDATWELVKQAYELRAWAALGYRSWDDYCTREFGTSRLRLPREEREEVVASLREIGMSTRAIAAATSVSEPTVRRDLTAGASNDAPEESKPNLASSTVDRTPDPAVEPVDAELVNDEPAEPVTSVTPRRTAGTDGKSYPATGHSRRPPLPDRFVKRTHELTRLAAQVEKLRADDRFGTYREVIAERCAPQLRVAVQVLSDLLGDLADSTDD